MSVKAWLVLIVGLAVIPPLAFSVYVLNRDNLAREEVVATLAASTVAANVDTIDRQLLGAVTTLRALSVSNALRTGDLREFHAEASKALADTGTFAIVADRDMNQLVNTRRPFGEPLGKISDPVPLQDALRTGKPVISDAFLGQTAKKWVFNTAIPLDASFGNAAVLVITQDSEGLGAALQMENLRGGWNAAIVDRNGIVMASTYMSSDIGKPFFLADPLAQNPAPLMDVAFDGKNFRVLSEKSELTGWSVNLWADLSSIRRPIFRTYRLLLLGGLALLAVGLLAAWLFGRQLSRSVRRLADDAHRLGRGLEVPERMSPIDELNIVSTALSGAARSRKETENEIRFLMREVAHRSKNQLTVVSSLAKQSAAGARSVEEFSEAFGHRIMGLARSTDLLIVGSVSGVELGELIRVQVEPFRPGHKAAMTIEGPAFRISAQAAQTVGLAIHEMATNAAKYGALSKPGGELSVKWTIDGDKLELRWHERLPFAIQPPKHKGFGTRLIVRTLSGALGADVDTRYEANEVEYRFVFPVRKLVEGGAGTPDGTSGDA